VALPEGYSLLADNSVTLPHDLTLLPKGFIPITMTAGPRTPRQKRRAWAALPAPFPVIEQNETMTLWTILRIA